MATAVVEKIQIDEIRSTWFAGNNVTARIVPPNTPAEYAPKAISVRSRRCGGGRLRRRRQIQSPQGREPGCSSRCRDQEHSISNRR